MLEWADRAVGAARSTSSEIAMDVATFRPDVLARFWSKVNPCGPFHPVLGTECWLWMAGRIQDGYGQFWVSDTNVPAHRVAYEAVIGKIPAGMQIDHLCRVRGCVNPGHLEAVTQQENIRRGLTGKHFLGLRKVHCPKGHPYSGENLVVRKNGHRRCRACDDRIAAERKARRLSTQTGARD